MNQRNVRQCARSGRTTNQHSDRRHVLLASACAVGLISGCATTPGEVALDGPRNEIRPLYRVQQPAGTAAGQYAVGRLDLAEGRIDAAIERFRNALTLDPNYVPAHNGLGVAYGQQGRFGEAAAAFRVALASGPASAHVLNNLGYAQMQTGELAEAWKSLERSFQIEPTNARTRANLRQLAKLQLAAVPAVASVGTSTADVDSGSAEPSVAASGAAVTVEPVSVREAMPVLDELLVARSKASEAAVAEPAAESVTGPIAQAATGSMAGSASVSARESETAPAHQSVRASTTASVESAGSPATEAGEVILSRAGRMALVRVAPNVYAMRIIPAEPSLPQGTPPVAAARSAPQEASRMTASVVPPATARMAPQAATRVTPQGMHTASKKRVLNPSATVTAPGRAAQQNAPAATTAPEKLARIEVSNGAGVNRLATRTAQQLRRLGAAIQRITNHRTFDRQYTVIEYRDGHLASAENLQHRLPVSAKLVPTAQMHPGVNIRLVLGRDMVAGPVARWLGTEVVVQGPRPEGAESL